MSSLVDQSDSKGSGKGGAVGTGGTNGARHGGGGRLKSKRGLSVLEPVENDGGQGVHRLEKGVQSAAEYLRRVAEVPLTA